MEYVIKEKERDDWPRKDHSARGYIGLEVTSYLVSYPPRFPCLKGELRGGKDMHKQADEQNNADNPQKRCKGGRVEKLCVSIDVIAWLGVIRWGR